MKHFKQVSSVAVMTLAYVVPLLPSLATADIELKRVGRPTLVSPQTSPIVAGRDCIFVANTPADTVDVFDDKSRLMKRISVGVDPVSIAIRPDGKEVWVSNHVSDSVSVIDSDPSSKTYLFVVATIQEFDGQSTSFDEPMGIAFADNAKAYVALSSENEIAVINVRRRKVTKRLKIAAQDPRAMVVKDGRLYVLPFESGNKTQLSGGVGELDSDYETFDAFQHSIAVNNVLSLGHVVDIVKHPDVPDRDLFVFDTKTDELIQVVDSIGTLLYGLAVDGSGTVYVTQADARNDVNGRSGTQKHGLAELENRAFLNRIAKIKFKDGSLEASHQIELEPLPPTAPAHGEALATPFAIQVTPDDSTLIATASGSNVLFTVDAKSGSVIGRLEVGSVPRGIALVGDTGQLQAWVLNSVSNTVTVVDVSDRNELKVLRTLTLEDPTDPTIKQGRAAFNSAAASTTGTFSCASCHPDGHTDQLLWVLQTPVVSGGDQIMPRSTMPIRGLRDTEPYHWDGIPGDPYGGNNSANIHGSDPPNSHDALSAARHLIDGGLAATMARVGEAGVNDEGKAGKLSAADRDAMAEFILSVPYPPSQRRPYTDVVSKSAKRGFELFHIEGDFDPSKPQPNVCGDCHRMPYLVSTNTPGTGMDAPTWRGAYDRWLILPQGRLNIIDFDFYRRVAEQGAPERSIWQFSWGGRRRFDPVWDMVLEASTGFSGAFARQATLNHATADDAETAKLIDALEVAAADGVVVLEVDSTMTGSSDPGVTLRYVGDADVYIDRDNQERRFTLDQLMKLARAGEFIGTFTARHGLHSGQPQPAIWTQGPIQSQRGHQRFPVVHRGNTTMVVSARHIQSGATIFVNGRRVTGSLRPLENELLEIDLPSLPEAGLHLLQIQNENGMLSNDFIFHVARDQQDAERLAQRTSRRPQDSRDDASDRSDLLGKKLQEFVDAGKLSRDEASEILALAFPKDAWTAAAEADWQQLKRLAKTDVDWNAQQPGTGATPLANAVLHGHEEVVSFLVERGADVNQTNSDGNSPLHIAAFLCRSVCVEILQKHSASTTHRNGRGETPIDVVSGPWTNELAGFYQAIATATGIELDNEKLESLRPVVRRQLEVRNERP